MNNRKWKYVMLAAAGGVLLQAGGCGQLLMDTLITNVLPLVFTTLLTSALGTGTT
jgi:hypothetical protein